MTQEVWCLAWSQEQNAVHVEQLDHHLSTNRQAYRDDRGGDYRLVYVGSKAEVDNAARAMHGTIFLRDDDRAMLRDRRTA